MSDRRRMARDRARARRDMYMRDRIGKQPYAPDMYQYGQDNRMYPSYQDGHHPTHAGEYAYKPVEAMGYFKGYHNVDANQYSQDYRGYDMRDMRDYTGYGESLTQEDITEWKEDLLKEVDEKGKQFFEVYSISQRAKQLGIKPQKYTEEELALVALIMYTDYCKTIERYIGQNMDVYIDLAKDWLTDEDSALKGSERLAAYYDCIILGED